MTPQYLQTEACGTWGAVAPEQLPKPLQALRSQLEALRQEQLTRSSSHLQSFDNNQRRQIELATAAIVARILGQVVHQWRIASAEGSLNQLVALLSSMWGIPVPDEFTCHGDACAQVALRRNEAANLAGQLNPT